MSWSILAFDHAPSVAHIVIACSDEKRAAVQEGVVGKLVLHKPVHFATSGATRQESVYNALQVVPAGYDFVSVHDAVRPLIEVETIEQVIGTDDSSLVERLGLTVLCVESQRENVKVTYPSDLAIVEATLSRRLVEGATGSGAVE